MSNLSHLFQLNRKRLVELLKPQSIILLHSHDIVPSNADATLPYKAHSDLFYFTGINQAETLLLIMPDAVDPKDREILFVKRTDSHTAIWDGKKLSQEEAAQVSGISHVEWYDQHEAHIHRLVPQAQHLYLYTNEHLRAHSTIPSANDRLVQRLQNRYPLHRYERLAPLCNQLRMFKSPEEIEQIQRANQITEDGFRRVLSFIRPDVGEWEIEAEWAHEFIRQRGGFAYLPIIGSGLNSCILHYTENKDRCKNGDLILMDVASSYNGWNADLTRTVPVSGKFSARQRQVYQAVLRVMREANQLLRPGNTPALYQYQVLEIMERELIELGLISPLDAKKQDASKPLVKKYFMHGTSHHLGLDVHDVNLAHHPFAVNMVFTIEPGIYIPEENIGIRLENNYLIQAQHNLDLTSSIPIEADEIESLMQANAKNTYHFSK